MAIKKSELYSSLWASCNGLRGGMDSSQYKDYILVLLFVKYVSDKYADDPNSLIVIPEGGSFRDMRALKGSKDIGNGMNKVIGALGSANGMEDILRFADFNDNDKLGSGQELTDRLTNLVAIFENPALDFSKNRAGGDDILGDAFEYLMRNFATESGKSKGQFYTPSEVSRVIAKILDIQNATNNTTFYDPTCGSGSLLLKALDEAGGKGSIYGQEKDVTTAALAKMNMILHGQPMSDIRRGQSTLSNPEFTDTHGYLRTFDFVVANPPFSLKNWATGFNPQKDHYGRFDDYNTPPDKNGDYAFLLHILKSLKSTGKGACILPHGVLFRGNAEADIRRKLLQKGYIKGIIGLPANLFYGTGIPACIILLDKEGASERKTVFMIDASKGFLKDGNKNRLREQDIHKIVEVFNKRIEIAKYSRDLPLEEISDAKNDYNLNIPRYIDAQEAEDLQDIAAHLLGGIPNADIEALQGYWAAYPSLKTALFSPSERPNYSNLRMGKDEIKPAIFAHPEFIQFSQNMQALFADWAARNAPLLHNLHKGAQPKQLISQLAEDLLRSYAQKPLIDKYDIYQHLLNYWIETLQDDAYIIAAEGWSAEPYRIIVKNNKGKEEDKGWNCELLPKSLLISVFFADAQKNIDALHAEQEGIAAELAELEEKQGGEEGYFVDFDKINKKSVQQRLKTIDSPLFKSADSKEEAQVLQKYLDLCERQAELAKKIKSETLRLDNDALARYATLTESEIKTLLVQNKWLASIARSIHTEMERISQRLTQRIKQLAERYDTPLSAQRLQVAELEGKVMEHLKTMGFIWN